jgi:hypothetical protein
MISKAVHACSTSGACYRGTWVGRTGSAITWALCGGAGERYIRGTSCPDVGTTVQAVCFSSSILMDRASLIKFSISEIRGPWDAATPRGFEGDSHAHQ